MALTTIPRDDAGKLALIQHINATLPTYATTFDLSADDLAQLDNAAAWFQFSLDLQTAWKAGAESAVAFKKVVRDGPKDSSLTVPVLPDVTPPAGAPFPDVFGFLGTLITRIKIHKNYSDAIGAALNILPSKSPGVDLNSLQPVLAAELRAGHPIILWDKNGMDGIEIEVDRGTGSFVLLAFDTVPDYLDTAPLPAPGASAIWKYRAIYRLHDERVGQWSQILEVAVKGG